MTQALATTMSNNLAQPIADTLQAFKEGVDNLLAKRSYFISQVLPTFKESQDYYEVKGKKSLAKGGAEKLASIYNLSAIFQIDDETMAAFSLKDMIAYVCTLYRGEQTIGQGRGCSSLSKNQGDANKTVKMAQKSAFIDSVIRSTGLSDIFTQDIENFSYENVFSSPFEASDYIKSEEDPFETSKPLQHEPRAIKEPYINDRAEESGFIPATEKQKNYLNKLISQRYFEPDELEQHFQLIEGASKSDASRMIEELLNN